LRNDVQPMFESKLFFHSCLRNDVQPMFESKLFFHL
jgi:hypothetical protein